MDAQFTISSGKGKKDDPGNQKQRSEAACQTVVTGPYLRWLPPFWDLEDESDVLVPLKTTVTYCRQPPYPSCEATAPSGTMRTWQDIFAEKIANMHLTEPWMLQEDSALQVHVLKPGWNEFARHHALGRFQCSQCFHEWSSAKVHVLFHMCWHQGQGMVWMRVFRQACRQCPNPHLEEPSFSQDTVEKLLHNLVLEILKYFYHMPVQASDLLEVVVDAPVAGPHDRARCEGCQLGICSKSRLSTESDTCKILKNADKAKTRHTPKHQGRRSCATPTHNPSCCTSSFHWKWCCCIGGSLLCILAALLFFLLYFTKK